MRKAAFVLLVVAAVFIAGSGLRAEVSPRVGPSPAPPHVPILTLDYASLTDDVVVYSKHAESPAITGAIQSPPVDLAVITDGLIQGAGGSERDLRRMERDCELERKMAAALNR